MDGKKSYAACNKEIASFDDAPLLQTSIHSRFKPLNSRKKRKATSGGALLACLSVHVAPEIASSVGEWNHMQDGLCWALMIAGLESPCGLEVRLLPLFSFN